MDWHSFGERTLWSVLQVAVRQYTGSGRCTSFSMIGSFASLSRSRQSRRLFMSCCFCRGGVSMALAKWLLSEKYDIIVKCFLSLWKEIGFAQSRETDSKLMLGYHPLSSDLASFFASSNTLYDTPAISGRYFSPSLMSTDIHFGGSYKLLLDKLLQYVLESGTIRRRCCAFSCWELGSSIQSAERR